jgi:RimJ/RimL family protein N-acetyltransferase
MKPGKIVYQGKTKKGKDITIRHLRKDDLHDLTEYMNIISKEQTYIRFQGEQITEEEEKKYIDDFLQKMEKSEAVKLLVFYDKKLVGVADISLFDKTSNHVGRFGITIAKEYRGEGIGKLLMNLVIEGGKKNMPNLKIIELGVFGNNGIACSMYERLGFTRFGLLPKGVKHRDQFVDHIYMYKNV